MNQEPMASPVRWLDDPPEVDERTIVVLTEALLPMAVCRDVVVRRAVEEKLSVVERFMIEVALDLGDVTVEDMEELVDLPAEATERIAAHLCEMKVLEPNDARFRALEDAARAALDREVLVRYREGTLAFVVLPRSDDVLAYENKGGPRPPMVDRLQPVSRAPVPEPIRSAPLADLLGGRVRDRSVASLPDDVVDVVSTPGSDPWRDECPVYRCTGRLRVGSDTLDVDARVEVYGDRDDHRFTMDLSDAAGIVRHWREQVEQLDVLAISSAVWEALGLDAGHAKARLIDRWGPVEWMVVLDADDAQALSDRGRRLGVGGGLEIAAPDGMTKTAVMVGFSPADTAAVHVFALEEMLDRIIDYGLSITPAGVAEAIETASAIFGLDELVATEQDVRDLLWRRGRHDLVYRLRAAEDFDYA